MIARSSIHSLLVVLWACTSVLAVSDSKASQPVNVIKFYCANWGIEFQDYQKEIVHAVLKATQDEYGDYSLQTPNKLMTEERVMKELTLGRHIHFDFYTAFSKRKENAHGYVDIEFPLFNGVLGLRKVIIRKSDERRVSNIASVSDFRKSVIGQAESWPDDQIYVNAGLKVVYAQDYQNLYPMLLAGRFDLLPLSVIEIDKAMEHQKAMHNRISIHKNTYVYYPHPVFLGITRERKDLIERLTLGLDKVQSSGEFKLIFDKYFKSYTEKISAENSKVFVLENPILTKAQNIEMAKDMKETYFSQTKDVFFIRPLGRTNTTSGE